MDKKYHRNHYDEETQRQKKAMKQRLRELDTEYDLDDIEDDMLSPELFAEVERFLR